MGARLANVALLLAAALAQGQAAAPPAASASPALAATTVATTPTTTAAGTTSATTCPASALSSQPYFQSGAIDLVELIPPPPAPGSPAAARDLEAVIEAQRAAHQLGTTDHAVADAELTCARFADVLGAGLGAAQAPKALYFLNRAALMGASASGPAKTYWWRPRPYLTSPQVERLADVAPGALEGPGPLEAFRAACTPGQPPRPPKAIAEADPDRGITSYPSGHAAFGMSCAILLARMVPEKRDALFERGREYGLSRVIVGAHHPTDVESGRVMAAVAAAEMQENAAFRRDFDAARLELRAALGLPRDPPGLAPKKPEPLQP